MTTGDHSGYKVGGTVDPTRHTYIVRATDDEFFDALIGGEYCYVLNARQMGKSSLRVHTSGRLQRAGAVCVDIDLTGIGSQGITADQWYGSLARAFIDACELDVDWRAWVAEREHLTPAVRFGEFIERVLLSQVDSPIVVFLDEIDVTLHLPFKDDFFAFIRNCHNRKAEKAGYNRLAFALLGVAAPSDLIADPTATPFNIGRAFELAGFTLQEAMPLAEGLKSVTAVPEKVLACILRWTGGQPFLTQKLCSLLAESGVTVPSGRENDHVERLVRERVLENWESQDVPQHLRTIRDRLLLDPNRAGRLLGLFQRLLEEESAPADGRDDQTFLKLTGLAVGEEGRLVVGCEIYAQVFGGEWLTRALADLRPYNDSIDRWVKSRFQDPSHLLSGESLKEAQRWASGKSLSDLDYQFLAASQELENRLMQAELELEKKQRQIEQVEAELTLTQQKVVGEKSRNKAVLAAALLLVVTLTGGIVATTWQAQLAQRRFNEVRSLANSYLFEIHDAIQDLPGSTPARRLVISKAVQYLDRLERDALGNVPLQRELAVAYQKIGDIQGGPSTANLGNTAGALTSYRKALAMLEKITATDPLDRRSRYDLAVSLHKIGDIEALITVNVAGSLASYGKARPILADLSQSDPADRKVLRTLAVNHNKTGDVMAIAAKPAEALASYRRALSIFEQLSIDHADDQQNRRDLAFTYSRVGDALGDPESPNLGDPVGALENYRRAFNLREQLARDNPDNRFDSRNLSIGHERIGVLLEALGKMDGALKSYRQAMEIARALAARDPSDVQMQRDLAVGYTEIGSAQTKLKDLTGALRSYGESLAINRRLAAIDPQNAQTRLDIAEMSSRLGEVHMLLASQKGAPAGGVGHWTAAKSWYQQALRILQTEAKPGRGNDTEAIDRDKIAAALVKCEAALSGLQSR